LFIDTGLDRVEDPQVLCFRYDYEDIPNKPDAAIEYSQLIEFERAGFEEFPFEGVRCKVRELLTGIAPVAPIQKSEDRKSDLHI
jgi:hypothetical protein